MGLVLLLLILGTSLLPLSSHARKDVNLWLAKGMVSIASGPGGASHCPVGKPCGMAGCTSAGGACVEVQCLSKMSKVNNAICSV